MGNTQTSLDDSNGEFENALQQAGGLVQTQSGNAMFHMKSGQLPMKFISKFLMILSDAQMTKLFKYFFTANFGEQADRADADGWITITVEDYKPLQLTSANNILFGRW